MKKFEKQIRLAKVDESTHTAYGIATAEERDLDNEVCDYGDTAPMYRAWSQESAKNTAAAGQEISLGNIRLQHGMEIAGKVTKLDFDDTAKTISIEATPVDDRIWQMLKGGFVTGFSQGGKYLYRRCNTCGTDIPGSGNFCPKCDKDVVVRYAARPVEVSFVDKPCLPVATFEYVKTDGSSEIRKFSEIKEVPVAVSKTAPKETSAERWAAFKLTATHKLEKTAEAKGIKKGMYGVIQFAELLESLNYLRLSAEWEAEQEGDESEVPAQLQEDIDALIETFLSMVAEETSELSAANKAANQTSKGASTMNEELLKAVRNGFASHFKKAAAHHEKMAAIHTSMHKSHMAMHDTHKDLMAACKAVVGETGGTSMPEEMGDHMTKMHKGMMDHSKEMASMHEKCAKAHKMHAEHSAMMQEAHSADDGEKAVKAMADAVTKSAAILDTDPEIKIEPLKVSSVQDDMQVGLADTIRNIIKTSLGELQQSSEVKTMVENAIKGQIADTLGSKIYPDATKAPGAAALQMVKRGKSAAATEANSWSGDLGDTGL